MKRKEYIVSYTTNGEEVIDIMNTIETMIVMALSRLNRKIRLQAVERCEFCE